MSDDELFYLQPGFDLNSLTIPRLRSILVAHDVEYPASSKKPQLIQIVTDEVLSKSRKLLSARARTKRTSKGITDMGDTNGGDDEELMPPPPAPKTPRSRKSKSNLGVDDAVPHTPSTSRRSRTPGTRKSSAKHPRASDTETDLERPVASARKARKSQPGPTHVAESPSVKIEEPDRRIKRESLEAGESPFSDENPFQSASSPSSESRRVSSTSRTRKSLGSDRRKSTSTSRRGQTTSPSTTQHEDGIRAPSRSTFEFPVAGLHNLEPNGLEPSEEFAPDAALELEEETAANGRLVRKSTSALTRRKKKTTTSKAVKVAPWAVLGMIGAYLTGFYRQEKINTGYCGVGQPNWSLASNPNIPVWVHENLEPVCEPCPQHGICYPNMEVKCEDDFLLTPHPLSLGGLVPLPPTCEPDSEKSRRIKIVADRAVEELRDRRAAYECGQELELGSEDAADVAGIKTVVTAGETKLEIPEETLKKEVGKMRKKGMTAEEYEDLWRGALGEIMDREEVVVVREDGSGRILLSSTSLARLPFSCYVRRSIRRSISRNRVPLSILASILVGLLYARSRVISYRQATAQIPSLVGTTLDRLATQAALKEDGRVSEGFISVGQLRDDVLRNVFSARERERVWKGVRAVVEGNSNIRAATREGGRTGEFSRVWEWIGPVNLASGLEGRTSGAFADGTGASLEAPNDNSIGKEMVQNRKWDEGRPIY